MTTTQLRVYQLPPDEDAQRQWRTWWSAVRAMRERHGFRVVAAVFDSAAAQFTWIVEHDGDFAAAEQAMFQSDERAEVFARPHPDTTIVRTEFVDRIA